MDTSHFQHKVVQVEDIKLHVVVGGNGPPVVLLHGFPQTWFAWRKVLPLLASSHTVVVPDLRGAGHSDCPQGGYDKATMAADIHEMMHVLGFERYAVCGHDIGAMVALAVACNYRQAVTHLAILDSAMPGWSKWEAIFSDPRVWHFSFHMKENLPERLLHGREYDYVSTFLFERTYDHSTHSSEDVDTYARAFAQPGRTRAALEWYRAFPKDHADALRWKETPLQIPVLALGGQHRWGLEMTEIAREFAMDVTGQSVADANHWLAEERPVETAHAILDFLR